jgi:hypothetical protein
MQVSARTATAVVAAGLAVLLLAQRPASTAPGPVSNESAIAAVASVPLRISQSAQRQQARMEPDTNRPGGDYTDYDVRDGGPEVCQSDCARDASCGSFTFVKPGIRGRFGHCFLKRGAPKPVADRCCISGVKPSR